MNPHRFQGKTAVLTGGGAGIGADGFSESAADAVSAAKRVVSVLDPRVEAKAFDCTMVVSDSEASTPFTRP
jgi:hypothetical protein